MRRRAAPVSSLIYISWYINGYGRPWAPVDVNPKMRHVHGQFAGPVKGCCFRLRITWLITTVPRERLTSGAGVGGKDAATGLSLVDRADQAGVTFSACGPLGPWVMSKLTT